MQSSSEFVVLFFSALTVISQALVSARLFVIHDASWPERMIAIGMAALTAAIPIFLIAGLGASSRKSAIVKTAQSNTSAASINA